MSKKWTEQEAARWQTQQDEAEAEREAQPSSDADEGSQETFVREERKVGRNEKVTIRDPESGEEQTLKYKQAEAMLAQGWKIVS